MNNKLITTIWILSSNDQTSQMTYRGISERVSNCTEEKVKEYVKAFPELFQEEIPKLHLKAWKEQMLNKKNRPKWIAQSKNKEDLIKGLTIDDVFRNRFRNSIDEPPLDRDLIKWGLDYIDNYFIKKEEKTNKWWVRSGNILIPFISLLIASYAINQTSKSQDNIVTIEKLKLNREIIIPTYKTFLTALNNSMNNWSNNTQNINDLYDCRLALSELNPYLTIKESSLLINDLNKYIGLLTNVIKNDTITQMQQDSLSQLFMSMERNVINSVNNKIYISKN
ncbi:hypothetical protein LNI88_11790 [Tenacibaculum dicentrarchi]|nr:hypothetical protein [Tenacibaculum dicentrarchi]